MRAILVLTASASLLLACSSPEGLAPVDGASTACSPGASGAALAIGGECLGLAGVRARVGGVWKAVPAAEVTVTRVDADTASVAASAEGAEAFELVITGARGGAILQQGYQSWGFSGAVVVPDAAPIDPDGAIAATAARTGSPLDEVAGVSYGAAIVGDPGGPAIAIAASSSTIATTAIAATRAAGGSTTTVTVLYGAARERLPPGASGRAELPPIVLAARASGDEALAAVAQRMKDGLGAGARAPRRPPGGWYSWNELFAEVTEKDVVDHVAIAREKLLPKGMPLVEIDDGWEGLWGDWTANGKFPSGMAGVATAITGAKLTAGVWLAPFLVDVESEAAKTADPALFVQGADGAPLVHQPSGSNRTYRVLDGTNPASMAIAAAPIRALAKAGYRYFKLDFLYAGALPGQRKAGAATGTMALRSGLSTLREAMGEEAVFNACGAPIFPVLGLADSLRVGSDTAFAPLSLAWADVVFAGRSLAARAFLAPLVFVDADQVQLRAPYAPNEARAGAFVAAMAGPAYALGDDLRKLPPDRLAFALAPEVIDLAGADAPARPDDPLEGPVPAIVTAPLLDTVVSHGGTAAPPPTRFTMTGKSGGVVHLTFDWLEARSVTLGP